MNISFPLYFYWLTCTAFFKSFSVLFVSNIVAGYFVNMVSYIFCGITFAESKRAKYNYTDYITLSIVAFTLLYYFGGFFEQWIYRSQFSGLGLFLLINTLFWMCLASLFLAVLYHVSIRSIKLSTAIKFALIGIKRNPFSFLSHLALLAGLLNLPFGIQQIMYGHFGVVLYLIVYVSLFFLGFWLALKYFNEQVIEEKMEPSIVVEEPLKKRKTLSGIPKVIYMLTLIAVILTPILFIIFILFYLTSMAGPPINEHVFREVLWSYGIWLVLSIIFVLIQKSESFIILLIVELPLVFAVYNLLFNLYVDTQIKGY